MAHADGGPGSRLQVSQLSPARIRQPTHPMEGLQQSAEVSPSGSFISTPDGAKEDKEVLVTGYAVRAPSVNNAQLFFEHLQAKMDMTTDQTRYPPGTRGLPPRAGVLKDTDRFDNAFFKMNAKQVDKTDIIIRMLLEVTQEALLDARLRIADLRGSRTGVYIGHCFSDYLCRATRDDQLTGYELVNGAHAMVGDAQRSHSLSSPVDRPAL